MELYILDGLLRRETVIDRFESLIWAERYSSEGDFEMVINSTVDMRRLLVSGARVAINESYRVMEIETVEDTKDSEGRLMLTVKGRSLEGILLQSRTARNTFASLTTTPKWSLTGTPGEIARAVFNTICRNNTLMVEDNIPFLMPGSIFPAGTIPEPDEIYDVELDVASVYTVIKNICDVYGLGFRLVRNFDASELYFDIYTGSDRTTQQTGFPAVVFSQELDNLTNTTNLTSSLQHKNVAYVFGKNGTEIVYADGVSSTVEGLDRRVLEVKADDIDLPAGAALTAALQQRGREELAKYRKLSAFDGEIPLINTYKYGVDYNLGDLVEMRNIDGATNQMRVTEQIFVSDAEGERAYPSLAIDLFITPGSWFAWDFNQTWENATGFWADA